MAWSSPFFTWFANSWWKLALVILATIAVLTYREAQQERSATAATANIRALERAAQETRAYIAKRRGECYDIYARERTRFNNAQAPEYDLEDDVCRVRYKNNKPDPTCARVLAVPDSVHNPILESRRMDCYTGTFTNEF
jgi:hypothetical protein